MNLLMILSAIVWLLTWLVQGFNFSTIMALVCTILFCGRKVGYFCKQNLVITLETAGIFLTTVFQVLLNRFVLTECILIICLRLVFLAIMKYDMKMYVYVTEERRRDN